VKRCWLSCSLSPSGSKILIWLAERQGSSYSCWRESLSLENESDEGHTCEFGAVWSLCSANKDLKSSKTTTLPPHVGCIFDAVIQHLEKEDNFSYHMWVADSVFQKQPGWRPWCGAKLPHFSSANSKSRSTESSCGSKIKSDNVDVVGGVCVPKTLHDATMCGARAVEKSKQRLKNHAHAVICWMS
jgi:hypothetical protein